nr:LA2681 family HEPN domain-containing protein [uncultured Methanoregula sp.]
MKIHENLEEARKYFDHGDVPQSKNIILEVEKKLQTIPESSYYSQVHANLGSLMIDLGAVAGDKDLIIRGKHHTEYPIKTKPESEITVGQFYNLANGYIALWDSDKRESLNEGRIDENYQAAKHYFRKALDLAKKPETSLDRNLRAQINTNFGNCLCSVGREVEAFSFYDSALKYDKNFGMALGNKAIELQWLAFLAHGHTHLFLIESQRLYQEALKQPLPREADLIFEKNHAAVDSIIKKHTGMKPENHINSDPISQFHEFSRNFCVKHQLYLTPTTFVGKKNDMVFGDPMFISRFVEKISDAHIVDRHITFLNQIKQDFVVARYLLIQSQYQSTAVDTIDKDVILFDPLDYSVHNAYIEFLKLSLKLTMDTFDKIAQFVREYCGIQKPSARNTHFRTIWTQDKLHDTLRPEFAARKNKFLFALFDLALDLKDDGYYREIYECRNAVTHRFLIVHEMRIPEDHSDITSRISREYLFETTITAMQLLRAAVMYLILFVDIEEKKKRKPDERYGQLPMHRVSPYHQWRPYHGDDN